MDEILDIGEAAARELNEETANLFDLKGYTNGPTNILYNHRHNTVYLVYNSNINGDLIPLHYYEADEKKKDPNIEYVIVKSLKDIQKSYFSFQVDKDLLIKLLT